MLWRGLLYERGINSKNYQDFFNKTIASRHLTLDGNANFWNCPSRFSNSFVTYTSFSNTKDRGSLSFINIFEPTTTILRCWFFYPIKKEENVLGSYSPSLVDSEYFIDNEDTDGFNCVFSLRPGYIRLWVDLRVQLNGLLNWKFRRHVSLSRWVLRASHLRSNRSLSPIESLWYTAWKKSDLRKRNFYDKSYLNLNRKCQGKTSCIGVSNLLYNWNYTLS